MNFPEKTLGNIGSCHCTHSLYRYYQAPVSLDAAYVSFCSFERAVCHQDMLTGTVIHRNITEILQPFLSGGRDKHKNIHFTFRDGNRQFLPTDKMGVQNDPVCQFLLP